MKSRKVGYYVAHLYDLGTNPYKTKYFGVKEFPSEEMLELAKLQFKKNNSKINKLYRLSKTLESYDDEGKREILQSIDKRSPPEEMTMKINHKSTLTLNLDSGTGNTTAILGSSKQGKSTAMMYIYDKYYKGSKWISTLYTANPHSFGGNSFVNKRLIIFPGFENKVIMGEKIINQNCDNKYNFVNMFDDLISLNHKKTINNLILTYRNSNISTIISTQYVKLLSKMSRSNFNNMLLFSFNTDEATEDVIKIFLRGVFRQMGLKTMAQMLEFYKKNTGNFKFMNLQPSTGQLSFHRLKLD